MINILTSKILNFKINFIFYNIRHKNSLIIYRFIELKIKKVLLLYWIEYFKNIKDHAKIYISNHIDSRYLTLNFNLF